MGNDTPYLTRLSGCRVLLYCDRLRVAREEKGLTQEEVALAIGVSQDTYRRYERGGSLGTRTLVLDRARTVSSLNAIARVLGLAPEKFVRYDSGGEHRARPARQPSTGDLLWSAGVMHATANRPERVLQRQLTFCESENIARQLTFYDLDWLLALLSRSSANPFLLFNVVDILSEMQAHCAVDLLSHRETIGRELSLAQREVVGTRPPPMRTQTLETLGLAGLLVNREEFFVAYLQHLAALNMHRVPRTTLASWSMWSQDYYGSDLVALRELSSALENASYEGARIAIAVLLACRRGCHIRDLAMAHGIDLGTREMALALDFMFDATYVD